MRSKIAGNIFRNLKKQKEGRPTAAPLFVSLLERLDSNLAVLLSMSDFSVSVTLCFVTED